MNCAQLLLLTVDSKKLVSDENSDESGEAHISSVPSAPIELPGFGFAPNTMDLREIETLGPSGFLVLLVNA
jgi:hypothetical protein